MYLRSVPSAHTGYWGRAQIPASVSMRTSRRMTDNLVRGRGSTAQHFTPSPWLQSLSAHPKHAHPCMKEMRSKKEWAPTSTSHLVIMRSIFSFAHAYRWAISNQARGEGEHTPPSPPPTQSPSTHPIHAFFPDQRAPDPPSPPCAPCLPLPTFVGPVSDFIYAERFH
jgi:hypothetical protein